MSLYLTNSGASLVLASGGVPVASVTKAVLQPSDISFVGWFCLPDVSATYAEQFSFSYGAFATRKVGSERRFFINSTNTAYEPVEIVDPGTYAATYSGSAPRATVHRYWGDIFDGKRICSGGYTWPSTTSLYYRDGALWWTMARPYENGQAHEANLGMSTLNDTDGSSVGYGPWRVGLISEFTGQYVQNHTMYAGSMFDIPQTFANSYLSGKTFGITGTGGFSGYQGQSHGPNISCLDTVPTTGTATDYGTANESAPSRPLLLFDSNHRLTVDQDTTTTTVRRYRRATPPTEGEGPYGCAYPQTYTEGGGLISSGLWAEEVDECHGAVWVDTPTKHGLVYFSTLVDTPPGYTGAGDYEGLAHFGYGNADGPSYGQGRPASYCCHGQKDPSWGSTGPFGTFRNPWLFIYDPASFVPSIQGTVEPHEVTYTHAVRMASHWSAFNSEICTADPPFLKTYSWNFGQAVYDSDRQYIFVPVNKQDTDHVYYYQPAIAVFAVS